MISRESLLHIPKSNYSYGYDRETLHIRIRTKKNDVDKVIMKIGDPYIWAHGGADGGNLNAENASGWTGGHEVIMSKEVSTEYFDYYFAAVKPELKRSRYAFILEKGTEKLLFGERKIVELNNENNYRLHELSNFFCFPYLNGVDVHKTPDWVKDTVWYQIFPDRFHRKGTFESDYIEPWGSRPRHHNFNGGDLEGIIDKLDYLANLGINGIYFCPIFKADSNHRYDTIDYMAIDEMLGDKMIFKRLVEEAHKRGIRIMLDAVFNHMGYKNPYWIDVAEKNESSEYKDWFCINQFPVYDKSFDKLDGRKLNYETFGRVKYMPKVNTENQEVINYFMKVGKYWITEFDIDAWRIDVANEVDHEFWRTFRKEMKSVKEDIYLLGEIWHDALPWLKGDQFDAAMNYPLTEAMIHYFCSHDISKETFINTVNHVKISYSLQVTENNFNLLDSHDTSRLLTIAKGNHDLIKLAYLFMFTQLGSPCIYYGSEIPMAGEKGNGSEDHRSCMTFNHMEDEFYLFMKRLIEMRHHFTVLKNRDNEWLDVNNKNVLAFKKENVIVLMNNCQHQSQITIPEIIRGERYEWFSDKNLFIQEKMVLKPYEYLVIK